jgi:signal transduction histidine kinase
MNRLSIPALTQYLALVFATAYIGLELYQDGGPWLAALILCAVLGIIYNWWPGRSQPLYLLFHLTVLASLLALNPMAMILGFSFSVEAMLMFPGRRGAAWVAVLAAITAILLVYHFGWEFGLLMSVGISTGYLSFGYFNFARVTAERERKRSQALLTELQEAHHQLKEYAARIEEMAVQEERTRLAREMHDTIGHRLTVAAVQLEGAQRLIPDDPERAGRMLTVVRGQVTDALVDLRHTVAALRRPLEADLPLGKALRRLAQSFEDAAGLAVHLELPPETPVLPGPQRLALYRLAQEGLTNVQRHAKATQVWLRLETRADAVRLTVADDGIGPPAEAEAAGYGLRGLRERAAQLGGDLGLEARPAGGAQLTLRLPLSPDADRPAEEDAPIPVDRILP